MSFHEVLFPANIAWGASGGPKFKTAVFTADSGHEQRTLDWKDVRAEYDVSHAVKRDIERNALIDFFMARRGMAHGFRFKDWNDYTLRQEVFALGDGVTTQFQITKRYTSDQGAGESWIYARKIKKIAWGTIAGVTVGAEVATRSLQPDFSDTAAPLAYYVNENTGIMAFKSAPFGLRYAGTSPITNYSLLASEMFGFYRATPSFDTVLVDYSTGKVHYRAFALEHSGLRRVNLATGAEEFEKTAPEIGFPDTSVNYDNQQIDALIAAGAGMVYVAVGGFNTQVIYKLSGVDYTIVASAGVGLGPPPEPGQIGQSRYLGCMSRNGARLIHVDLLASDHSYSIFSANLVYEGFANVGAISASTMIGPVCPIYETGFACLLNRSSGVELWDDSGNKLAVFGQAGSVANWCLWDAGAQPGVIVNWRDAANGHHMGKFSTADQKIVWEKPVPVFGVPAPNTPVAGELVALAGKNIFRIETTQGVFASRAVADTYTSDVHAWDPVNQTLLTSPAGNGGVGKVIDTDIVGVSYSERVEIKIGYGEFHVPVRFDSDHIDISNDTFSTSSWSGIPLIEVRDWSEIKL